MQSLEQLRNIHAIESTVLHHMQDSVSVMVACRSDRLVIRIKTDGKSVDAAMFLQKVGIGLCSV